jgi:hypothetical protein
MTADANLYQYPPGDFRWRPWLLIERIDEVFAAAQRAGMCQPSLRDPRGAWALDRIDRDPFVAAVWNCDQILKPDHLPDPSPAMFLADAEWFCQEYGARNCTFPLQAKAGLANRASRRPRRSKTVARATYSAA